MKTSDVIVGVGGLVAIGLLAWGGYRAVKSWFPGEDGTLADVDVDIDAGDGWDWSGKETKNTIDNATVESAERLGDWQNYYRELQGLGYESSNPEYLAALKDYLKELNEAHAALEQYQTAYAAKNIGDDFASIWKGGSYWEAYRAYLAEHAEAQAAYARLQALEVSQL